MATIVQTTPSPDLMRMSDPRHRDLSDQYLAERLGLKILDESYSAAQRTDTNTLHAKTAGSAQPIVETITVVPR